MSNGKKPIDVATWVPLVTAFAAVITAGVLAWGIVLENSRSRFTLGVDLVMKLDERFDSEAFRAIRRTAAKSLLKENKANPDNVLDFFETLGMLVRRGVINEEMTWHTFFYWVNNYWYAAHNYIKEARDPTFYEDFGYLRERLAAVEKRKYAQSDIEIEPTEDDLKKFLREEAGLK